MGNSLGLFAQGIGTGLTNFTDSYRQAKRLRMEQDDANAKRGLMQMQMQEQGYEQDPNSGAVTADDLGQQRQNLAKAQVQSQLGDYEANGPKAQAYGNFAQGLVSKAVPGVQIPQGMSAHDLNAEGGLINTAVRSGFAKQGMEARLANTREGLGIRADKAATQAGQTFEGDPLIRSAKQTQNSITRAQSILHGDAAVTAPVFNTAMQDFINSVAQGGSATEGKVNREMPHNIQILSNELSSKFGNVPDLRKDPGAAPLLKQLDQLMNQVYGDYDNAIKNQANDLQGNFSAVTNPKVQKTVQGKMKNLTNRPRGFINPSTPGQSQHKPGDIVKVNGTNYTVGADGDTLEPFK